MRVWAELGAAVGSLTAFGRKRAASNETLAASLAFYPLVGLALGGAAAAVAATLAVSVPAAAGPASVLLLGAVTGGRGWCGVAAACEGLCRPGGATAVLARLRGRPGVLGVAGAASLVAAKIAGVAALAPPARTAALLLTPMLGAWAIVVQCYGGTPRQARGRAAALVGRARFREFGWASLIAMGVTLAVGQALGLGLVVIAALTTLGMRVAAHRRLGGLSGRLLAATRELVETAVLVTLGVLSALAQ